MFGRTVRLIQPMDGPQNRDPSLERHEAQKHSPTTAPGKSPSSLTCEAGGALRRRCGPAVSQTPRPRPCRSSHRHPVAHGAGSADGGGRSMPEVRHVQNRPPNQRTPDVKGKIASIGAPVHHALRRMFGPWQDFGPPEKPGCLRVTSRHTDCADSRQNPLQHRIGHSWHGF